MKPGQFMFEHWAEVLAAILLLIGFFIALIFQSPVIHYITIFLAGVLCGRILYEKHKTQPIFPYILMIIGFLLGFMLGAITANKFAITLIFLVACAGSYWAHKRGYLEIFKTEGFIR